MTTRLRPGSRRRRWTTSVLIGTMAVLCATACNDSGSPPPAEEKAAPSTDGFESSWTGHVSRLYPAGRGPCTEAVKAALKGLRLEIADENGAMFETNIEAEYQDGTSLLVDVTEISDDETRVSIKVGYFLGDGDKARRVHNAILDKLGARQDEESERRGRWRVRQRLRDSADKDDSAEESEGAE